MELVLRPSEAIMSTPDHATTASPTGNVTDADAPASSTDRGEEGFPPAQVLESFSDPIFVKDLQHRWVVGNAAFFALFKLPREQVLGKSDPDFFPPEQVKVFWENDDALFSSRQYSENEERLTDGDGSVRYIWTRKFPLFDAKQRVIGLAGIITDLTPIKSRLEKAVRLESDVLEQQRVIQAQAALLNRLAVPVIQIWEGILLLALVGELNNQRGEQITERLLEAITRHRARFAIIDITGIESIDAAMAKNLVKTVQAVQLLGCRSMMVGISAGVAAQMVRIGVDLGGLVTHATLQQGLEVAMKQLSYTVTRRP